MADKQLKVHGVPQPKGTAWLNEVRLDATRATINNLVAQKERAEFEEAKARGVTVNELLTKGKEDLGLTEEVVEERVEQGGEAPQEVLETAPKKGNK